MSAVVIGSINFRGLSNNVKRCDIFNKCRDMYDISILVDTHSTKQGEKQWQHEWGYISRFSSHSSASRGVAVLFKNSFEFHINQEIIDECGNFIILDINIQDYRMTLVAIYGPNEDNPDFFKKLVFNINQFDNSSVIIAGDWNVVQDYRVDTVNYIGENNPKSKLEIHQMINSMDLVDVWRDKNPGVMRYTWRGPNKKQSRLDYFLVSSDI